MNMKNVAENVLIVGGIVHLLMGIGQMALIAPVSPYLGAIQIAVGAVAVYVAAKKLKLV